MKVFVSIWVLALSRGDGHRLLVTPEKVLSEYNEDSISVYNDWNLQRNKNRTLTRLALLANYLNIFFQLYLLNWECKWFPVTLWTSRVIFVWGSRVTVFFLELPCMNQESLLGRWWWVLSKEDKFPCYCFHTLPQSLGFAPTAKGFENEAPVIIF